MLCKCCAKIVHLHNQLFQIMATVKAIVRTTKKSVDVNIRFRISDGRNVQLFHNSELRVNVDVWDAKNDCIKARTIYTGDKNAFNKAVNARKQLLLEIYEASKDMQLTSDMLERLVDEQLHPEKYKSTEDGFFPLMEEFLQKRKLSEVRENNFRVLIRALKRYELLRQIVDDEERKNKRQKGSSEPFVLDIDTIDVDVITDIESFLRNEHTLYNEYPEVYKAVPGSKQPQQRGNNTICALFNKLRAFFNWCNEQGKTDNKPFAGYEGVTVERYGTPYYITIDERNKIADFDLSSKPTLEVQRDIFIFHCLIGCRVSDLLKMTDDNIINGVIEYIPHKTIDERPAVVRVPLNERALKLVEKYRGTDSKGRLFPFISAQKYNDAIKEVFKACGVTRIITVLNPTTGKEEKKPINEVASSHLARRTFIGNLYKKVKDPNLVGSLSGHAEGSKAFARYREIDDEIKTELVKMIE